jgi:hypothetical protein
MRVRWAKAAIAVLFVSAASFSASGQIDQYYLKYNSGQTIQPIFEGWARNADGSYAMHFGYMNRNYVESLSLPVGPNNSIEPGGPDRGQPTYFYPRINRSLFSVTVPKDWGKKELVWALTVHGKTEKAIGWLQPEWEINPDPARAAGSGAAAGPANQPPTLDLTVSQPTVLNHPGTLRLTAAATDDGLPKPGRGRGKPAVGQETPPILKAPQDAPVNVPQLAGRGRGSGPTRPEGLTVSWIVWRGPADVVFEPAFALAKDGKADVMATFAKPGEYVLRGKATDGQLSTQKELKVTVNE